MSRVILSALGFVCTVATILDVYLESCRRGTGGKGDRMIGNGLKSLLGFSLVRNTKSLLNTKSSGDQFTCFYGLRFLSMAWIVLMHTWGMLVAAQVSWNLVDVKLVRHRLKRVSFNNYVGWKLERMT